MGRSSTAARPQKRDADTKLAQGRLSVLELAKELGNVAEACRQRGLDRTSFYEPRGCGSAPRRQCGDPEAGTEHGALLTAGPGPLRRHLLSGFQRPTAVRCSQNSLRSTHK